MLEKINEAIGAAHDALSAALEDPSASTDTIRTHAVTMCDALNEHLWPALEVPGLAARLARDLCTKFGLVPVVWSPGDMPGKSFEIRAARLAEIAKALQDRSIEFGNMLIANAYGEPEDEDDDAQSA